MSAWGDIACRVGTNFLELLHKFYDHTFSGYGTKDQRAGTNAFTGPNRNAIRFRENLDNEFNDFQHVLDDVIREKTPSRGFEN